MYARRLTYKSKQWNYMVQRSKYFFSSNCGYYSAGKQCLSSAPRARNCTSRDSLAERYLSNSRWSSVLVSERLHTSLLSRSDIRCRSCLLRFYSSEGDGRNASEDKRVPAPDVADCDKKKIHKSTTDNARHCDAHARLGVQDQMEWLKNEKLAIENKKKESPFLTRRERFRNEFLRRVVPWEKITVSWDTFPYYIHAHTKNLLVECTASHLKHKKFNSLYGSRLTSSSRRILLQSIPGTELYRERVVRALAQDLQVPLLVLDSSVLAPYDLNEDCSSESESDEDNADSGEECTSESEVEDENDASNEEQYTSSSEARTDGSDDEVDVQATAEALKKLTRYNLEEFEKSISGESESSSASSKSEVDEPSDQANRPLKKELKLFSRTFSTFSSTPLRICIVGSGPAGFYTAEKILKAREGVEVDIIDRLPTPFGLVRSGVAPDHPETKIVINQFSRVAQNERCSFFGNVSLGSSISMLELREMYNAVVLSYGAESDRSLGISGEEFAGVHAAREFVWWYNGHPDCRNLAPDLKSTDTAVILGQGNVALDAARILLRPPTELARTDVACHALAALEESAIRRVFLVGRRGPVQAACTAKELREVLGIKDLAIHIQQADLVTTLADAVEMKNNRIRKRVYELLSKAAASVISPTPNQRELHFVFFHKPDKFLDSDDRSGRLAGIRLEKTTLKEVDGQAKQVAVGTGVYTDISCGIALKSIGYKSVAIDGLPFDNCKGIVPNIGGLVLTDASQDNRKYETGLYVCGWLKRGPTGIVATNLYCAEQTVACISEDIDKGVLVSNLPKPGSEGLLQLLGSRSIKVVPFNGWEKIDVEERRLGNLKGKPRQKLTTWEELLKVGSE